MPLTYQLYVDQQATDKKEKQKKMLQILNSLHLFHAVNILYLLPEGRNLEAKKRSKRWQFTEVYIQSLHLLHTIHLHSDSR